MLSDRLCTMDPAGLDGTVDVPSCFKEEGRRTAEIRLPAAGGLTKGLMRRLTFEVEDDPKESLLRCLV